MTPKITDWHGCYEDGWRGMIIPESFAHPAKFSYSLICRIVRHGLDQGYWKPGETIGDCFGGVATGGIVCGYHGLNWVGCELEPRFVELGNKNLAMHGPRWAALESACSVKILQGDSRRFAEVVGQVAGVVSSPPYAETHVGGDLRVNSSAYGTGSDLCRSSGENYASSPGQIGSLKSGSLDGVVTSPPFSEPGSQPIGKCPSTPVRSKLKSMGLDDKTEYGHTDGQIGNDKGETYWQAMHAVYSSMRDAMKPCGVAAIVVKDYVSKKARVPLCDQTCMLLESLGFEVFERCRCWLVKETREPSLFGGEHVTTKARKSFFRRLAESKGSPAIDWEEVIWCKKSI